MINAFTLSQTVMFFVYVHSGAFQEHIVISWHAICTQVNYIVTWWQLIAPELYRHIEIHVGVLQQLSQYLCNHNCFVFVNNFAKKNTLIPLFHLWAISCCLWHIIPNKSGFIWDYKFVQKVDKFTSLHYLQLL